MPKIEVWQLKQRQGLPLNIKERYTERSIIDWYNFYSGQVYVSFSGGKDSTVLLHQVRKYRPDVPAVFCDTGLEHPQIRDYVKRVENVIWMKPRISFNKVIDIYGYPAISKKVARFIRDMQNPTNRNWNTRNLRLTGYNRKGIFCPSQKCPKKWLKFVDSGIKISEQCCDFMKKEPFHRYQKETGRFPIIGVLAEESNMREKQYLNQGCNAFESKTNPISMPMAFWTTKDIFSYRDKYRLSFSKAYETESSTGCMFCMFGVHLEKEPNRFQRMKIYNPKYYDYCINKLGCGKVLNFMEVKY